jgi:hypothetical protein
MWEIPKHSIAAGLDFGLSERLDLPKLTLVEEYVISQARLLVSIVKLTGFHVAQKQSGKRGHVIVFPQDSKKLEDELQKCFHSANPGPIFPRTEKIHEYISIAFVGSRVQWEALVPDLRKGCKTHFQNLQVRVPIVYQWLKVLKAVNPHYRDIQIDHSPQMIETLEGLTDALVDRATIVTDAKEILIDNIIRKENIHDDSEQQRIEKSSCPDEESERVLPSSFVTRATRPNADGSNATVSLFKGRTPTIYLKCFLSIVLFRISFKV